MVVWLTGLPSSGKTTISEELHRSLWSMGYRAEVLDGDEMRRRLSKGAGFSRCDREEHIRRIGFVAELLAKHGVIAVVSAISPYRETRDEIRGCVVDFIEVYVNAPIAICEARDVKGLYRKARSGQLPEFTGVDQPYEPPLEPEVECRTDLESVGECVNKILNHVLPVLERHQYERYTSGGRIEPELPPDASLAKSKRLVPPART